MIALCLCLGCESEQGALIINLRTDLLPGYDFRTVEVDATRVSELGTPGARVHRGGRFVPDTEGVDSLVQVAELVELPQGLYHVELRLLTDLGAEAASGVVRVPVSGRSSVAMLITRDCLGVECPLDGDRALTCYGGRCVDACCVPGSGCTSDACPPPLCRAAGDCLPLADCATPSCLDEVCFYELDHLACTEPLLCHAELGCVEVTAPPPEMDAGRDAGPGDAGPGCVPTGEICNLMDDDCDGLIDDGFDLATDRNNCGRCGIVCSDPPGSSATCRGGTCEVLACDTGREDCDGAFANGCEADLTSVDTCGSCTNVCSLAMRFCDGVSCISMCPVGTTACGTSCVDTMRDPSHCGGCDSPCALPSSVEACVGGICVVAACTPGFEDCDAVDANGCEVDTTLSDAHCGGCSAACGEMAFCRDSTCDCDSDALDCNPGMPGCETSMTVTDCGGCGVECGTGETCVGAGRCRCGSSRAVVGAGSACPAATEECCASSCRDYQTAFRHCGACGNSCRGVHADTIYGQRVDNCTDGACLCGSDSPCNSNQACCLGFGAGVMRCRAAQLDPNHCGACRVQCGTNETCSEGRCHCGGSSSAVGGGAVCPVSNACDGTSCT